MDRGNAGKAVHLSESDWTMANDCWLCSPLPDYIYISKILNLQQQRIYMVNMNAVQYHTYKSERKWNVAQDQVKDSYNLDIQPTLLSFYPYYSCGIKSVALQALKKKTFQFNVFTRNIKNSVKHWPHSVIWYSSSSRQKVTDIYCKFEFLMALSWMNHHAHFHYYMMLP